MKSPVTILEHVQFLIQKPPYSQKKVGEHALTATRGGTTHGLVLNYFLKRLESQNYVPVEIDCAHSVSSQDTTHEHVLSYFLKPLCKEESKRRETRLYVAVAYAIVQSTMLELAEIDFIYLQRMELSSQHMQQYLPWHHCYRIEQPEVHAQEPNDTRMESLALFGKNA